MAFRPYVDNDGTTMLSDLCARTGRQIGQMELQLCINGWTSQMFLVKGDVSDITPDDVEHFAKRRGYAKTTFAVKRLCEVIRGSRSPVIERFGVDKWRLRVGPKRDVPSFEKTVAILQEWFGSYHPYYLSSGAGGDLFTITCDTGNSVSTGCFVIPSWTPEVEAHGKWIERFGGKFKERWQRPHDWFVDWCGSRGLCLSSAVYIGLSSIVDQSYVPDGGTGFTVIYGPVDFLGRRPVWHMPLIDERLAALDFGMVKASDGGKLVSAKLTRFDLGASSYLNAGLEAFMGAPNRLIRMSPKSLGADLNAFVKIITGLSSGYDIPVGFSKPVPAEEIARMQLALGALGTDLKQVREDGDKIPVGSSGAVFVRNHTFVFSNWKLAVPYGLEELIIPLTKVGVSVESAVPIVRIEAERLNIATRFQVLREYAERCKLEPETSAADKANLQKFIEKSASQADAVIYSSVFAGGLIPPSMAMVENLEFVRKGREADVNVLDDKQDGVDITLRDLAKRLDSDLKKGRKHSFFSQIVDEVLDIADLSSEFTRVELPFADKWSFEVSTVQGADDTIFGRKGGGGQIAVDPTDAAFLVAHGATSTVPDRVWAASAINETVIADMRNAGSGQLSGRDVRPSLHSVTNSVKWDNLAPAAFCDALGFPVMSYADQDSYVRAFLMLKGPSGEPSDMLASMFFANTLDM